MKRKTLTLVVGLLLTLSLVGIGFASWVISANDSETIIGNVEVQTVTDRRLDITVSELAFNDGKYQGNSIVFGMPTAEEIADAEIENPWLTNDAATLENLSVTFQVVVRFKQAGSTINASDFTFNAAPVVGDGVTGLVTAGYLTGPTVNVVEVVNDNAEGNDKDETKVTYNVTLSFAWGADFGNKNPYLYYNKLDVATYGDEAYAALNAINGLSAFTYQVNITANIA